MILLLSPAKTLDFETPAHVSHHSQPDFLDRSEILVTQLRQLAPHESRLPGVLTLTLHHAKLPDIPTT